MWTRLALTGVVMAGLFVGIIRAKGRTPESQIVVVVLVSGCAIGLLLFVVGLLGVIWSA